MKQIKDAVVEFYKLMVELLVEFIAQVYRFDTKYADEPIETVTKKLVDKWRAEDVANGELDDDEYSGESSVNDNLIL